MERGMRNDLLNKIRKVPVKQGCAVCSRVCGSKPLGDLLPVDQVPPGGDVVRPAVLIVQVVGMLPHVAGQQRDQAFAERTVLVGGGMDQ